MITLAEKMKVIQMHLTGHSNRKIALARREPQCHRQIRRRARGGAGGDYEPGRPARRGSGGGRVDIGSAVIQGEEIAAP